VGEGSIWLFVLLLSPFAAFVVLGFWRGFILHPAVQWSNAAPFHATGSGANSAFSTAVLVAMWNYMGWDNASTVAQEVENPQRNYPRAMIAAAILTAITYILPLAAMALAGLSADSFSTGDWAQAARALGGPGMAGAGLGIAVIAGGCIMGVGMFNALVMSYTRLPMAMAEDGMLPRLLVRRNRRGVPWVSILFCGLAWALALKLPFERLISIDLILYGSSLVLEFVALAVLRFREPQLERPFKAGNLFFACLLGVGPTVLIAYALYVSRTEKIIGAISALIFATAVGLLGPVLYSLTLLVEKLIKRGKVHRPTVSTAK
jgi:amino acid transporter